MASVEVLAHRNDRLYRVVCLSHTPLVSLNRHCSPLQAHKTSISCLISPGCELGFNLAENAGVFQQRVWGREDSEETTAVGLASVRNIFTHVIVLLLAEMSRQPVRRGSLQDTQDMSHPLAGLGVSEPLVMPEGSDAEKKKRKGKRNCAAWMKSHPTFEGTRADFLPSNHLLTYQPRENITTSDSRTIQSQLCRYPFLSYFAFGCVLPR